MNLNFNMIAWINMLATNDPRVADGPPAHKCIKILRKGRAGGHTLLCCVARSALPTKRAGWRPHAVMLRCAFGSARCDTGKTLFPHGWWLGVATQIKK